MEEIQQAKKIKKPTKRAVKFQIEPEFVNEVPEANKVHENQTKAKRGRGRPRRPVRIPNPKYKNTSNSKILLWNKIVKDQGYMNNGTKMPKKGSPEYSTVRKIYDELVKGLEPIAPPTSPQGLVDG